MSWKYLKLYIILFNQYFFNIDFFIAQNTPTTTKRVNVIYKHMTMQ